MANLSKLDVFLNGSRTYVQGTQILSRTADALADGHITGGLCTLKQAVFTRITDQMVAMSVAGDTPVEDSAVIGRGSYSDGSDTVHQVVWSEHSGPAKQARLDPTCEWKPVASADDHPLSGAFQLSGLHTSEDYLNALIQAIKGLHSALADDVTDIWFTGLRRANIPMVDFPAQQGLLTLTGDRVLGRDGEFQSIQRTRFEAASTEPIEAVITFAFKSKGYSHVD